MGEGFEVDWGGEAWELRHADGRIGLHRPSGGGLHLALAGLTATGRYEDRVFTAEALVGFELVHGRLLATFEPKGWHGLIVRAAWGSCREGRGIDLEVQASTTSVGQLKRVEILVESRPMGDVPSDRFLTLVSPRDRLAAGSTYDGREPSAVLRRLNTLHVPEPGRSSPSPPSAAKWDAAEIGAQGGYLEVGHADDIARHLRESADEGRIRWSRYALFGHDLEKGVVLRARLRGVHVAVQALKDADETLTDEIERFLAEPLPLRTA